MLSRHVQRFSFVPTDWHTAPQIPTQCVYTDSISTHILAQLHYWTWHYCKDVVLAEPYTWRCQMQCTDLNRLVSIRKVAVVNAPRTRQTRDQVIIHVSMNLPVHNIIVITVTICQQHSLMNYILAHLSALFCFLAIFVRWRRHCCSFRLPLLCIQPLCKSEALHIPRATEYSHTAIMAVSV